MLAREEYLKKLSDYLSLFQTYVSMRGQMALFDVHVVAEDVIKEMLNIAFGLELINLNDITFNQASIDLGDSKNGVAVQVTATKTSAKIEETIRLFLEHKLYEDYPKLFVFIIQPKQKRYKKFNTQKLFEFNSDKHVLDFESFAKLAQSLEIKRLKQLVDLLDTEINIGRVTDSRSSSDPTALKEFSNQVIRWFSILNYSVENDSISLNRDHFSLIINVPARRGYDRIYIRGVSGVAEVKDLHALKSEMQNHRVDEAWLISARRIAPSVRNAGSLGFHGVDSIYAG